MHGISIRYEFSGDEDKWEAAIRGFIAAIDADPEVSGRFTYRVNKAKEGNMRVHWGSWDRPETVATLQSRDYFKSFAAELQAMAGESLSAVPLTEWAQTAETETG